MKYLYKKANCKEDVLIPSELNVEIFTPTIRRGLVLPEEKKSLRILIARLLFQGLTLGKAKIYCFRQNGELVHTSYVVPKCIKFPFLGKDDYEIGPCLTYPNFRGKGYYPIMLRYICSTVGMKKSNFYMIVDEHNASSIRGIEKAGFQKCGNVKATKILKRYRLE